MEEKSNDSQIIKFKLASDPEVLKRFPLLGIANIDRIIDSEELRPKNHTFDFPEVASNPHKSLTYVKKALSKIDEVLCSSFGYTSEGKKVFDNSQTMQEYLGPIDSIAIQREAQLVDGKIIVEVGIQVPQTLYNKSLDLANSLDDLLPYNVAYFEPLENNHQTVLADLPWIYATQQIDPELTSQSEAASKASIQYLSMISAYMRALPELKGLDFAPVRETAHSMLLACHDLLSRYE